MTMRSFTLPACLLLFLASLGTGRAVTGAFVESPESIRPIAATLDDGPPDPRRPVILSRHLNTGEQASPRSFEVTLRMRHVDELRRRVENGEIISPREMAAKYNPLPDDYAAARRWLGGLGFRFTRDDANHLAVFATGSVAQVEKGLRVRFARVGLRGERHLSAVTAPSLPAELAPQIIGINGLQPHLHAHPQLIRRAASPALVTTPPYIPSSILTAYASGLSSSLTGAGQSIAIVIDVLPHNSDITAFWQNSGVTNTTDHIVGTTVVGGGSGTLSGEESLDAEWSSSIAPGATVRVYATADLTSANLDAGYQQVYADATTHPEYGIHQMSMSYGGGETDFTGNSVAQLLADSQYFLSLSSAGVTCFASSGDGGSTPDSNGGSSGPKQVETPASDPSVTAVGGTSLYLNNDGTIQTETTWSLGGGGKSIVFKKPTWQTGNGTSGTARQVPDLSLVADPYTGTRVYYNGTSEVFGGTSWGSPTMAGFCALINQARANAGLGPVGLLNPHLYPLIGTGNFRDITSGGNGFNARTGYDMATGIGVPVIAPLLQTLLIQTSPIVQTVTPGSSAAFAVKAGGTPTGYQWQRMPVGSTTWSNLSNNATYSGATAATLTLTGATTAMSGDQFQCLVNTGTVTLASPVASTLIVDSPYIVSTLAGKAVTQGTADGTGSAARFSYPSGVAVDASGNSYVADFNNHTIRKITPDGVVTTPYGQAGVAGSANGTGTAATFNQPNSVAIDTVGNLYVADSGNSLIRKITPAGVVSTLAGQAGVNGSANGTGTGASFYAPQGVAVDGSGNVYVADSFNYLVRKITPAGVVTTLAGQAGSPGYIDAISTQVKFGYPISVAVDSTGNVFVADVNNSVIRKVTQSGVVTTPYGLVGAVAATGQVGGYGNMDGIGTKALFNAPIGLAFDASGTLFVVDSLIPPTETSTASGNNLLRRITPAGVVSTLAGQVGVAGAADGFGASAQFYNPQALAVDSAGTLYIADTFNQTMRQAVPTLPVVTLAATTPTATTYGSTPGVFTVARTGSTFATLNVSTANVGGTAVPGTDYTALPGTVTLGPGVSAATITVNPVYQQQAPGTRTVTLTLDGAGSYSLGNPSTGTVTITEPTLYQGWKLNRFGSNAYVASIGGDTADPNKNGVPNLLEYAFGGNPLATGGPSPLPAPVVAKDGNGIPYLALTYTSPNDTTLSYTVQVTSDLSLQSDSWHSGASYTTVVSQQVGSSSSTTTVRDLVPISQAVHRFMRVQVGSSGN